MKIMILCDKCGKEINVYSELATTFPWVTLTFRESFDRYEEVDLCTNCQRELIRWVRDEKENNDVDVT